MPRKRRKLIDPAEIGSKGGHARAQKLSPDERREACRLAVVARWKAYAEGKNDSVRTIELSDVQKRKGKLIDPVKSGAQGGHARARNLSAEERSKGARLAIVARWKAYYQANPEKWKAREARAQEASQPLTNLSRRQYLMAWLKEWRKQNGIGDSGRSLSNRSLSQLERMFELAQSGEKSYRSGRRWGRQIPGAV
jgi:hypothetical protein